MNGTSDKIFEMSEEFRKDYSEGQKEEHGSERMYGTEKSDLLTYNNDSTDGIRNTSLYGTTGMLMT